MSDALVMLGMIVLGICVLTNVPEMVFALALAWIMHRKDEKS